MRYKTIGILGGMGPEATAELYLQIVRIFQKEYGAKYDDDFPEIIIINLPIPDVVENPSTGEEVRKMLIEGVKKLEVAGADFIAIPCNTVTKYLSKLQNSVNVPIINIVEETCVKIKKLGLKNVGLLGTETTINCGLYVTGGINLIKPLREQQKAITRIIMNVLAGMKSEADKLELNLIISDLKRKGAKKVILGCTELSLLTQDDNNTIDTLEILAEVVVQQTINI